MGPRRIRGNDANRKVRDEAEWYLHDDKGQHSENAGCLIRPDKRVSARIAPVEQQLGANSHMSGCTRAEFPEQNPSLQRRDLAMHVVDGKNDVVTQSCKLHAVKERLDLEEDPNLD